MEEESNEKKCRCCICGNDIEEHMICIMCLKAKIEGEVGIDDHS